MLVLVERGVCSDRPLRVSACKTVEKVQSRVGSCPDLGLGVWAYCSPPPSGAVVGLPEGHVSFQLGRVVSSPRQEPGGCQHSSMFSTGLRLVRTVSHGKGSQRGLRRTS